MLKIQVPGYKNFELQHLVLDYNGTLALDGALIEGIKERLGALSKSIKIHVLTADTFGSVKKEMSGVNCTVSILPKADQIAGKRNYVSDLGAKHTVAVGNGRNDQLMLKTAELGIVIVQGEGASVETVSSADIVVNDIKTALDLLLNPLRLIATLRS